MKSAENLYVYAVFADSTCVRVGRLLSRHLDTYGRYEGFFKYDSSYLAHEKAYALDPVHLPLEEKTFDSGIGEIGMHAVFDDSLPDAWGRHILARKGGLEKQRFAPAHLLRVLQGGGLGRLMYFENDVLPPLREPSIDFSDIALAIREAGKLEESLDTENAELRHLLACGSSAGGARPKVLTRKDDQFWLAKFASRKDVHPELFLSLEEAGLTLAGQAGLEVPNFTRVYVEERGVLLIERFDVTGQKGRNALASFRTLVGVEDQYQVSYSDMAQVIRLYSSQPAQDLEMLYRQMIVNVLLRNTDDHLQNFAMLHTEDGWRLSPAYDIVPNVYQVEQILKVNGKHAGITPEDVISEGKKFGLSAHKSKFVLHDVVERIADWKAIFVQAQVPEEHTVKLKSDIEKRFRLFASC